MTRYDNDIFLFTLYIYNCIVLICACIPCYLNLGILYTSFCIAIKIPISWAVSVSTAAIHPHNSERPGANADLANLWANDRVIVFLSHFLLPKKNLQTKLRNLDRLKKKEHSHGVYTFEISQNWGCKGVRVELVHICFCQGSWLRPWYWAPCTWPPPQCMKHLAESGGRQAVCIDANEMLYSIAGSASFEELITSND